MRDPRVPVTSAIRVLREHEVAFDTHFYDYEEKGGTAVSSKKLGVDEHHIVKTLVMETDKKDPLVILMHGDRQVSTKELARIIGVKKVSPCAPDEANRHSGYVVGGTSPFGTRKTMPVYLQKTVLDLEKVYLNGGARGFLVSLSPKEIVRVLSPTVVDAAVLPVKD